MLCIAEHHQLVSGMLVLFVMRGSKQDSEKKQNSEKKLKKTFQKFVDFKMLLGVWFSHCPSFSPATEAANGHVAGPWASPGTLGLGISNTRKRPGRDYERPCEIVITA